MVCLPVTSIGCMQYVYITCGCIQSLRQSLSLVAYDDQATVACFQLRSQICTLGIGNSIFRLPGPCHALISHRNNEEQIFYCNSSRVCTKYCINSLQIDQETGKLVRFVSSDQNRKSWRREAKSRSRMYGALWLVPRT